MCDTDWDSPRHGRSRLLCAQGRAVTQEPIHSVDDSKRRKKKVAQNEADWQIGQNLKNVCMGEISKE